MASSPFTSSFSVHALEPFDRVDEGDDLSARIADVAAAVVPGGLRDGDIVVVACKPVSIVEGRRVDLADVVPSPAAYDLAQKIEPARNPAMMELVIRESRDQRIAHRHPAGIGREVFARTVVATHRRGYGPLSFAGVDRDLRGGDGHSTVLLLPDNCDESAARIRVDLRVRTGAVVAVVLADSDQLPDRAGSLCIALGSAGIRPVRTTSTDAHDVSLSESLVDLLVNAAGVVMGQAGRGVPAAVIRGVAFEPAEDLGVLDIVRDADRTPEASALPRTGRPS